MTSHDVRDVLNLPQDGTGPRLTKKPKSSGPRPNLKGLAREVQNLGGDNPIAIVPEVSVFKKRRLASRKPAARWELRPFSNSARSDATLVLRHWRRKNEDEAVQGTSIEDGSGAQANRTEPQIEDSAFAKYNVDVVVPQYGEDQYKSNLHNPDWTRDETDYLLELVKSFDLRWPIIWDRYDYHPPHPDGEVAINGIISALVPAPKNRTMEDLKARYYEVAAKMMAVQKPVQYMTHPEYTLHETMTNFNPQQEKLRKEFAINSLSRSRDEAREEESLLLEVKRILARSERMNEERRELYNRLDYPHTDQDISPFKSSAGLQTLLHNLMNVDKSKKRKSLMGADGVSPASAGPGAQPLSAIEGARRESIAASTSGGHRDSLGGDKTPTEGPKNNKKGAHPERRKLSEQEEQVYGVSHHDRLTSGVTFRYEKITKHFNQKSGQQQLRITNVLNELDIPARLVMPTAAVATQFEQLIIAVNQLVDLRKVADKLDQEIKIEEQRKLDRDKAKGIVPQVDGAGDEPAKDNDTAASAAEPATAMAAPTQPSTTQPNEANRDAEKQAASSGKIVDDPPAILIPEQQTTNGDDSAGTVQIKEEDTEKEKSMRPGSSGAHKRSASVLSTTSEKSTKRQRK